MFLSPTDTHYIPRILFAEDLLWHNGDAFGISAERHSTARLPYQKHDFNVCTCRPHIMVELATTCNINILQYNFFYSEMTTDSDRHIGYRGCQFVSARFTKCFCVRTQR